MGRRRPYVERAQPADHYAQRGERIAQFGTDHGGGLMSVRQDDSEARTIVELYRLDPTVTVRVPLAEQRTAGLAKRNPGPDNRVRAENVTAYALTTRPLVRLTDSVSAVELTPRQARSLARELQESARAAELLESGAIPAAEPDRQALALRDELLAEAQAEETAGRTVNAAKLYERADDIERS